ncbi:unnamed protein product [Rangifer tarandus platyrhynchus]|uniref:Uncharacterized protein n=1 Tax=Rangifer tarandus platyrhynchus TaxID=3082113 RepID=A0ABN8Y2Y1_RANTA|nr:unnamed protein product [Rangifer tarandus platyrhynchus]
MARTPPASGHCGGGRRTGDGFLEAFFPRRQRSGVSPGVRRPLSLVLGSGGQALGSTTTFQALYLSSSQRCILNYVRLVLAGLARGGRPRGRLCPGVGGGSRAASRGLPSVRGNFSAFLAPTVFPPQAAPRPLDFACLSHSLSTARRQVPRPLLRDPLPRSGARGTGRPSEHRAGQRSPVASGRPGPGRAPAGNSVEASGPRGARRPGPGSTRQRREGRAGKRGSRKRVAAAAAAAAGPLERRERRRREGERGGGRPGGRRERGRQAEGGLISMQQRSRARLHCFNTSPLLRANLSPFSRRTLLPQMLLFSNETDN